jgi:hypothetical protein
MRGVLQGEIGTVRWGYHVAATVGPFTITRGTSGYRLAATVVEADVARLRQQPLVFVMPLTHGDRTVGWHWAIRGCELIGDRLVADLGGVEVRNGTMSICPTGDSPAVAV